jgi:hypothetical protein
LHNQRSLIERTPTPYPPPSKGEGVKSVFIKDKTDFPHPCNYQ